MGKNSDLYRLQEIDTTWDKVRRRLLKLQNISGGSEELRSKREQVAVTETSLAEWQTVQKDAELESRSLTERIADAEARLMSGDVRNPKELESLQSSVESMRRHKEMVEERGVEAMMKAEELAGALDVQQQALSTLETDWQSQQQSIESELQQRKKEFVYLKRLREQTVEKLPADSLEQYEHLRRRKNGIAVARLDDDVCNACHMQVPRGVIGEVRRSDALTFCPGCGRILLGN
ncbi:MAG: C4-type zinc ribbon domain-containing protein [Caldilineaceae bacterium]|nr:hypothetical protein [Caldilineaceae bacterium]